MCQKGHKAHTLTNKLNKFIDFRDIEEEIVKFNKNKKYIEKVVIDIKITKTLKRYRLSG